MLVAPPNRNVLDAEIPGGLDHLAAELGQAGLAHLAPPVTCTRPGLTWTPSAASCRMTAVSEAAFADGI